jgi:acyl transferase domain-containing protein/acyl carrier protein
MGLLQNIASVQSWLVAKLAEYLDIDPSTIDIHEPFASYGLESAEAISLSGELEEWLGRDLSPSLLYDYPSISILARYLAGDANPAVEVSTARPPLEAKIEPIAIIGMSCRFPGGATNPDQFWQLLENGVAAHSEIPQERWDIEQVYDPDPGVADKMYTRYGAFLQDISGFDAQFFGISPREALRMDPQQRLLLETTWEALEHAGQAVESLAGSRTGVFVGFMNNHEYSQLQMRSEDATCVNDPYFSIGSASSITSGRLSYTFDLQGPNITVDTACSSSLVSVHLACQSLQHHESDLALAAGVNAIMLAESMINACKMHMLAADGRCKTFDAAADGFVLGEGCGVVVLKRLSDAIADGDSILAVIRGSAVNQDGRSNGLTAPNQLAQQAVIRQALLNAGVAPHQVQYVEAHGSGTALGDPIEVAALNAVLGEDRSQDQQLVIGAVKTNIGHLAGAAGVAGLIKTVLALHQQTIPPHLHLQQINPNIPQGHFPIVIPDRPIPWRSEDRPRIAGVSSFGWSGTNAHLVLEEAPAPATSGTSRNWQLLLVSAKTNTALDTATDNLLAYLKHHPDQSLADIAYTYQTGRNALSHRRMVVCRDVADAVATLEGRNPERLLTSTSASEQRSMTFMFPGLGDHYIHMAQQLYETEPAFRTQVDHCCDLLQPYLGLDLRTVLYPGESQAEEDRRDLDTPASPQQAGIDLRSLLRRSTDQEGSVAQKLNQTIYAQPALFVVEYALAQLWQSWGIQPQAMIGYSLGEYVAACLSGVISLEDALALVAQRARLIHELPQGAMLAVALSEEQVQPFLNTHISLSAVNGTMLSVLAGPIDAIVDLEHQFTASGIACRRLRTTHAFHSAMMDPIVERFIEIVKTIHLNPPQTPYISNVTGTWITAEQATSPAYWAQHLRQPVRFADGLHEIWQQPGTILVEVGPGQMLGSMALQHPTSANSRDKVVLQSLRHPSDQRSDVALLLRSLGQLWLAGVRVDWAAFYAHEQRRKLRLPTYPFERERYWVETKQPRPSAIRRAAGMKTPDIGDWFYIPTWKQARPFLRSELSDLAEQQCWLVFADTCTIGNQLAERLRQQGQDITLVVAGDAFRRVGDSTYTINPQMREDYDALLKHLHLLKKAPHHIIHLWSVTASLPGASRYGAYEAAQSAGFYSLLFLAQALGNHPRTPDLRLIVLSNHLHSVVGGEELCPEKATILGPCKVIPKEYSGITCRHIDIVLPKPGTQQAETLITQLITELRAQQSTDMVAYRGDYRWVQTFEPIRLEEAPNATPRLRQQGVYLITGGLGGLGMALAEYLAETVHARLILVGRSTLPPREEWAQWSADEAQNSVSAKIRAIQQLEALGAEVLVATADVANQEQMQAVVAAAHEYFGTIHGVIHAAGIPGEGLMQRKDPEMVARVFAPKVLGTLVLDAVLRDEDLDFIVYYSSSNAITGGLGEVDYCAANAFLDTFAHARRFQRTTPVISLNWGPWQWDAWQSSVYAALPQVQAQIQHIRERYGITFAEGTNALLRVLANPLPQVLVLTQELDAMLKQVEALASFSFLEAHDQPEVAKPAYTRPNLRNPFVAPRNETEQKVADIWQELLGIERVGVHDHFFELGGNSLVGMILITRLQKALDVQLSAASLYEAPTVSSLVELVCPAQPDKSVLEQNSSRGKLRRERFKKQKLNS